MNFLLRLFTEFEMGDEDFVCLDTNPSTNNIKNNNETILQKRKTKKKNKNFETKDPNSSSKFFWDDKLDDPNYNPFSDMSSDGILGSVLDDIVFIKEANANCKQSSTKQKCLIM